MSDLGTHFIIDPPRKQKRTVIDEYNEKINPNLPKLPFFTMIAGPRGSGKTNLICNLLDRKHKGSYANIFRPANVAVYKPTKQYDKSFDHLDLQHYYGPNTNLRAVLVDIEKQQEQYKLDDNMLPVYLVLDDITQIKDAWIILEKLGYVGRHYGVQITAITHKLSSAPRGVRTQCQQWILFEPMEQSEVEWIYDTFASRKTKDIWAVALRRCWDIPYNFAYLNFEERDHDHIYHSGFNAPLFTPEELAFMRPDLNMLLNARMQEYMANLHAHRNDEFPIPDASDDDFNEENDEIYPADSTGTHPPRRKKRSHN